MDENNNHRVDKLTLSLHKMDMRHAKNTAMRYRTQSSNLIDDELNATLQALDISGEQLAELTDLIEADCVAQLEQPNELRQRMLETCTAKLPQGDEEGEYVVVDFGGRFFRIVYVKMNAPHAESILMESKIYPLSAHLTNGKVERLFDFIATSCKDFCARFKLLERQIELIMVIAFPARQHSINSAEWIRWTKNLNASMSAEKMLFEDLLATSLEKTGLNFNLKVLCNDSTACLYTGLAEDPNTRLGLILGTGFNVSLLRLVENEWHSVSSELGSLSNLDEYLTCFDRTLLDSEMSTHPGEQVLEKMITGKYIAELFRLICKDLIDNGVLFNGISSQIFDKVGKIPRHFLSQILSAAQNGLNHVQDVLISLDICAMYADAEAVVKIAQALVHRSAALVAACLIGLLRTSGEQKRLVTIMVDGSLWKSFPYLSECICKETEQLAPAGVDFQFRTSYDGSAKGAAFIAALTSK